MIVLKSTAKSVIVLKAYGLPVLRIFPGHNNVKKENLESYFKNDAAKGQRKIHLSVVGDSDLNFEDKAQAAAAKKKNDILNKAQVTIKAQTANITKKNDQIASQDAVIADLKKKLESLEAKISKKDK